MKKLRFILFVGLIALSMGLYGCSGDDGAPGQDVELGTTGETVGLFNCSTCHGNGAATQDWLESAHANQGSHVASCATQCHNPLDDARDMPAHLV